MVVCKSYTESTEACSFMLWTHDIWLTDSNKKDSQLMVEMWESSIYEKSMYSNPCSSSPCIVSVLVSPSTLNVRRAPNSKSWFFLFHWSMNRIIIMHWSLRMWFASTAIFVDQVSRSGCTPNAELIDRSSQLQDFETRHCRCGTWIRRRFSLGSTPNTRSN